MLTWLTAMLLLALAILSLFAPAWAANTNPYLVGGPNALPPRTTGLRNDSAPAGAHLTYYGGRVV